MKLQTREDIHWPVPLRLRGNRLGAAVREYAQTTEETRGEAPAFARALDRANQPSRHVPAMIAGLAMTGAVTAGVLIVLHQVATVPLHRTTVVETARPAPAPLPSRASTPDHPPVATQPSPMLRPSTSDPLAPAAPIPPQPAPIPPPAAASIRLAAQPSALPAGKVDLNGQALVLLSGDGVASGRSQAGNTEVALSQGRIELHVSPRAPGHQFAVRAGPYRFTVVGTVFTIWRTSSRLELVVSEGTVVVSRGTRRLATVGAGAEWEAEVNLAAASQPSTAHAHHDDFSTNRVADRWPRGFAPAPVAAGPAAGAAAPPDHQAIAFLAAPPAPPVALPAASPGRGPTPAPSPAVAAPPPAAARPALAAPAGVHPDCGHLAASQGARQALTCYQDQAARGGLTGETAQYELARLWRDSLGDFDHALAAFEKQRSRFPNGALRTEADLSIIELLPRLNRHAEALTESERFLAAYPKAERRGEIHLLRGNIFREALHDLDHAEREYARAAEAGGRVGDDSRFLRAVCLEALGRVDEARKAYEAYLQQARGSHTQEAKKRLDRLRP